MTSRERNSPSDKRYRARRREKNNAEAVARVRDSIPIPPAECVDCNGTSHEVVTGVRIYPHRPDLSAKQFLLCKCGAYVGFHAGTEIPLGRPAGKAAQRARSAAHSAFDRLWLAKADREGISRKEARGAGYRWLAEQLGLEPRECHIGWMDAATAQRVVDLCQPRRRAA